MNMSKYSMSKLGLACCILFLPKVSESATVTYNAALESSRPTIRNIGVDPAGNLLVVTSDYSHSVTSISPSAAVNWTWTPFSTDLSDPASAFGVDGSTYISGSAALGIANSSVLFAGTISQPITSRESTPLATRSGRLTLEIMSPKLLLSIREVTFT